MAPLSTRIAHAMYEIQLARRGLGTATKGAVQRHWTPSQENQLQVVALVFATISVVSSLLAFYWFMRMRRSFRHDLVMLLIQSDMFKALWFMVYPIVVFTHGPVPAESTFCQVNGFFLAVGLSASDIAVLLIAVHSALYIFKPRATSGEGGLYPYRHYAYLFWFLWPLTVASLAFINGKNAYKSLGTYCYLPVRPFWYRLALSWIPRYVIFIVIVAIYASIYYYVRNKFHGFNREGKMKPEPNGLPSRAKGVRRFKRNGVPLTPKLACHGLIDNSRQNSEVTDPEARMQSISTLESPSGPPSPPRISTHRFIWGSVLANSGSSSHPEASELSTGDSDSFIGPLTPEPLPAYLRPAAPVHDIESIEPSRSRVTSWHDDFVSRFTANMSEQPDRNESVADRFTSLRAGSSMISTDVPIPASRLQLLNSRGQNLAASEMLRTREKIRRQLRFLFIYPLVYMGMWVLPLASHTLQYDDRFAMNPPFGLTCATTVFVCSQAAVDCWLFSTREKPWKHVPGNDGTFLGSLKFWSGWAGVRRRRRKYHGPGKTREEMVREARAAYQRREAELAQRRLEAVEGPPTTEHRRYSTWWEATGLDGAMGTVYEEISGSTDEISSDGGSDSTHVGTQYSRKASKDEEQPHEALPETVFTEIDGEKDGPST